MELTTLVFGSHEINVPSHFLRRHENKKIVMPRWMEYATFQKVIDFLKKSVRKLRINNLTEFSHVLEVVQIFAGPQASQLRIWLKKHIPSLSQECISSLLS